MSTDQEDSGQTELLSKYFRLPIIILYLKSILNTLNLSLFLVKETVHVVPVYDLLDNILLDPER